MQPLIAPLQFEYTMSDFLVIKESKSLLDEVGIHLEEFSQQGFVVRELPMWMKNIDEKIFIEEMIDQLLSDQKILEQHADQLNTFLFHFPQLNKCHESV